MIILCVFFTMGEPFHITCSTVFIHSGRCYSEVRLLIVTSRVLLVFAQEGHHCNSLLSLISSQSLRWSHMLPLTANWRTNCVFVWFGMQHSPVMETDSFFSTSIFPLCVFDGYRPVNTSIYLHTHSHHQLHMNGCLVLFPLALRLHWTHVWIVSRLQAAR